MSAFDQSTPEAVREEIARIEARIEAFNDSIERSRKVALLARLVLGGGAVWIVLIALRIVPFAPINIVGAMSAVIGGIVLFGSNSSTLKQTEAARAAAEAARFELIDKIALREVTQANDRASSGNVFWLGAGRDRTLH